ncbi:MAG: hydroxymethylbilane synthase [Candidatus Latescibacterota bacterium]
MNTDNRIILGARGSALALTQAELIRRMLRERNPDLEVEISVLKTEGDIDRSSPLSSFGGRGAFVRTIEDALLRGEIDIAVHSLKDLPSQLPEGLVLGAAPVREDPRDALVSESGVDFQSLEPGSVIATGSIRRRIQLGALRPDLSFCDIRGNIETRIRKVGSDGIKGAVLAYAGLKRLGIDTKATQVFSPEEALPAPCQGALGLECRAGDERTLGLLREIENHEIRACVDVERAFIAALGLGCHAPVAALAVMDNGSIRFDGLVGGNDGEMFRRRIFVRAEYAEEVARSLAEELKEKPGIQNSESRIQNPE